MTVKGIMCWIGLQSLQHRCWHWVAPHLTPVVRLKGFNARVSLGKRSDLFEEGYIQCFISDTGFRYWK